MRVSTEDQAREGFSLPEQRERLKTDIKAKKINTIVALKLDRITRLLWRCIRAYYLKRNVVRLSSTEKEK